MYGIYHHEAVILEGSYNEVTLRLEKEVAAGADLTQLRVVKLIEGPLYSLVKVTWGDYEDYTYEEILDIYQEESETAKTFIGKNVR